MVGPKLRHATTHFPGGAVVCRQAIDLTHEEFSPVTALIGMAAIIGSGLDNPSAAYLPIRRGDASAEAFSASCGGRPAPELAVGPPRGGGPGPPPRHRPRRRVAAPPALVSPVPP